MSVVEIDPCSADDVLGVLANAHQQHTRGLDALLAAGLPVAAAGLIYSGHITGKSQRSEAIIRMCQERVDAGADPAPIGIALSILLVPSLLASTPYDSELRKWYCPPTLVSDDADSLRGTACREAAAATTRGSGELQPVGGDELAWIVYCCIGVDTSQSNSRFAERIMTGLERGDLDPEIALAAALQRINLREDEVGIDLSDMADAIATGFARECGPGRLSLPPVIV